MNTLNAPLLIRERVVYIAHHHDEWPAFRLWFAVTTVTASIVFNLGIFTLLVGCHMLLDVIKYRSKHQLSWHTTIIETLREGLVDIFFITLGLLLALAFHYTVAIGGLGRLARLEILILNLILRVGPRLKIAEHLLEIVMYWKHHMAEAFAPGAPLNKSEQYLLLANILIVCSILLAPFLTSMSSEAVTSTIKKELTPRLELSIMKTVEDLHIQGL